MLCCSYFKILHRKVCNKIPIPFLSSLLERCWLLYIWQYISKNYTGFQDLFWTHPLLLFYPFFSRGKRKCHGYWRTQIKQITEDWLSHRLIHPTIYLSTEKYFWIWILLLLINKIINFLAILCNMQDVSSGAEIGSASPAAVVFAQSLSHVRLFVILWTVGCQATLTFTITLSLLKLTYI